jgi:hypothetical protein
MSHILDSAEAEGVVDLDHESAHDAPAWANLRRRLCDEFGNMILDFVFALCSTRRALGERARVEAFQESGRHG